MITESLPHFSGLLRCGKSCRLRWTNYLRPDIKRGNFSREEEDTIIMLHGMLGNRFVPITRFNILPRGIYSPYAKNCSSISSKKMVQMYSKLSSFSVFPVSDGPQSQRGYQDEQTMK